MATSETTTDAPVAAPEAMEAPKKRNPLVLIIVALVLLAGGYYGYTRYQFASAHESTDDAQVEGDVYPVLPRVSAPVLEVKVTENQQVKKGDVLVTLDPADFQQRVNAAEASLAQARAQVTAARAQTSALQANIGSAQSNIGISDAARERLEKDLRRAEQLRREDIIPQSEYDATVANLRGTSAQRNTAEKQVAVARGQVAAASQQIAVAEAVVKQRQADLDNARLQLSYTTITAPADGIISKKNVQPGQVVGPGQQLLGLVGSARTWVTANFKETQLGEMRVGQRVKLEIDAYPKAVFEGHIESMSAATGARFALLPPDNASGNFVKVTQRVPVKIALDKLDQRHPLRAGMSVNAVVTVK